MDANNIVVPIAIDSASITIVVISLVLIIAAMIITRSKAGGPVRVCMLMFISRYLCMHVHVCIYPHVFLCVWLESQTNSTKDHEIEFVNDYLVIFIFSQLVHHKLWPWLLKTT